MTGPALDAPAMDPPMTLPEAFELAVVTFDGALTLGDEPGEIVILVDLEVFG